MESRCAGRKPTKQEIRYSEKYPDTETFKWYNENPKGHIECDCVYRALAGATGISWTECVAEVAGYMIRNGRDADTAAEDFLKEEGFIRMSQPKKADGKKYTGAEFCEMLNQVYGFNGITPKSIYASIGGHHVVAIRQDEDGKYKVFDIWNSTGKCINKWFVR